MCCRRRRLETGSPAALRAWRRFVLRRIYGRAWHYWGELLNAAKQRAQGLAGPKAKAKAKAKPPP